MAAKQINDKLVDNPSFLRQLVQTFLQEYLEQELEQHLGVAPYERTPERTGHRNGYKSRQFNTRVRRLALSVPQVREGNFNTELFQRYQRSEQALINCLQQMVIQGVSTRRVRKITEELCGLSFSRSQVSEISKQLDAEIQTWLNRPLEGQCPYVYVDARYERVRRDHRVESHAVLIAKGVNEDGQRDILGMDVCRGENETNWSEFFESLHERGLSGVQLVISDAHEGLVKALTKTFPGVEWQRCQVHFRKNVLDKVRVKDKAMVKERLNHVFAASDKKEGVKRLNQLVEELSGTYPDVADMLEQCGEDTLSCQNYPGQHRRRICSTNGLERFNEEIRRRTKVIRIFPNRDACLRLVGALCMEQAEEWQTGRRYLNMEERNQPTINDELTETETVANLCLKKSLDIVRNIV